MLCKTLHFDMFLKKLLIFITLTHFAQSQSIYDLIDPSLIEMLPCSKFFNATNQGKMWAIKIIIYWENISFPSNTDTVITFMWLKIFMRNKSKQNAVLTNYFLLFLSFYRKVFDSSSKIPTGILSGNVMDLGNFDECIEIEDETDNVFGKYCGLGFSVVIPFDLLPSDMISMIPNKKMGVLNFDGAPLMFSMCLPNSCSPTEFQPLINNLTSYLGDLHGIQFVFSDTMCQTKYSGPEIDTYDIVGISILSIIIALVVASTTYDVVMEQLEKEPHHIILVAFSLYSNGKKLVSTRKHPDQIQCLSGMRFISIMWIIAGHRYSTSGSIPSANMVYAMKWKKEVYSQYIQGAPLAVDTFLCISGIVLAYSFIKSQQKPNAKFNIFLFYIHRYLRLTPSIGALFLLVISIIKYIASGPLWPMAMAYMKDTCIKWWWSYFLYIQNYVNLNEICLLHTWYLSMDMQIFIISPIILIPLVKYRKQTIYALGVLLVISIIIPAVITYKYKTVMFSQDYYDYYYYVTHTRLAPWFIGLWMGAYIIDARDRKFKINLLTNLAIWIFILVGMGTIVFIGNDIMNNFERVKNAAYISLHRAAWSVGLCWIIFACIKGYGGIVNWFLSSSFFQVLARISYAMYVVHIGIVMLQIGRMRVPSYISDYDLFYMFAGDLIVTMVLATFWTLLFESPIIILEKVIFGTGEKRKEEPKDVNA